MKPKFELKNLKSFKIGMLMPVFLLTLPNLVFAQTDIEKVHAFSISTSDPFFTATASDQSKQWYLPKIHVPEAWDYSKGSNTVTVAIIDTGIHASHIELNDGRVVDGYNSITNQSISANSDSDDNGHGTEVAGVIGAITNNAKGIAGINWNVHLMPIKALGPDGSGDVNAVATGIIWATDHNANIINLSLGGGGFPLSSTLSNAITYAYNHGVLIVAAAGNDLAENGLNLDTFSMYPVCADNGLNMVLGVAASDEMDVKAKFSNFSKNCVDITAPGTHILTTTFLPNDPSDNVLVYGSGTSMAAPIVSGVAALLKASNPNLSNVELRNILIKTADNIDAQNQTACLGSSCKGFLGSGRINALNALIPHPIPDGTLVRQAGTNDIYYIENGVKRLVSAFVFAQRGFVSSNVVNEANNQLSLVQTGNLLPPLEGTLIKSASDPQVYVINQELKRPLTYLVFSSRGYKFSDVKVLADLEVAGFTTGDWYWPPDGTMVLLTGSSLVYVMDHQVRRPVTYFVFSQRKFSFTKVVKVTSDEFLHIPFPYDSYWLAPLDGTLVKSDIDPGIYVIENQTKRLLSLTAFLSRGYSFSKVKVLPQVEVDVIAPGTAIP